MWGIVAVLIGAMLLAGGCGQKAAEKETSPAQTSAAETEAVQTGAAETAPAQTDAAETEAAEESTAAADGAETGKEAVETEAETPGGDAATAQDDIADISPAETAQPGEEADVQAPVHVQGEIVRVEGDSLTVNRAPDSADFGELIIHAASEQTVVVDAVTGLPAELSDLKEGESFEAYLGPAMTMSLPPQTTAYAVIVNIPEDFKAPVFVIAADAILDTDNGKLLDAYGEQDYLLADDVEVQPYLTRNIVTLDDIREGSRCLAWTDEYDRITKLVLFAD